jgi:hypothetical protein
LCEKEERKEFALTEKTIFGGKKKGKGERQHVKKILLFSFFRSFFLSFSLREE